MALDTIRIRNLQKHYDRNTPVLDIHQLELRAGELTCLLGTTGCGKTTLLNIIAGLDRNIHGGVEFSPEGLSPSVGYHFQRDLVLPWKNVRENILLSYTASGRTPSDGLAERWLDALDLTSVADAYPHTLSTGTRQRVAFGRAMAWGGDIRLYDEPFSAQDFARRVVLETLLREHLRQEGVIGIVVTHNLDEAVVLADRIVVLGGRPAHVLDDFNVSGLPADRSIAGRRAPELAGLVARAAAALTR